MTIKVADLCDSHASHLKILELTLNDYGAHKSFHGAIRTIKCFEDNSFVKKTLAQKGDGKVLVIDGGGSRRCALLGDVLAQLAVDNHWSGVLINGCIRDSDIIATLPIGVKAIATHPLKSNKKNQGEVDVPVCFGDVLLRPKEWLYADQDGVAVSGEALHQKTV